MTRQIFIIFLRWKAVTVEALVSAIMGIFDLAKGLPVSEETRSAFTRQRRNLMVMSVAVFLAQYVGLEFNEISILGNKASITNSGSVLMFLWWLLCYWLVRYVQYFHEIGGDAEFKERLFARRTQIILDSLTKKDVTAATRADILSRSSEVKGQNNVLVVFYELDVLSQFYFTMLITERYKVIGDDTSEQRDTSTDLSFVRLLRLNFRASMYIMLRTAYFTEYLLPLLLFLLPVVYWFFPSWFPVPQ